MALVAFQLFIQTMTSRVPIRTSGLREAIQIKCLAELGHAHYVRNMGGL